MTVLPRWVLDALPVRQRLTGDPLAVHPPGRFVPIVINQLKLTGNLHSRVLARRVLHDQFRIDRGRRLAVIVPFRDREAHLADLLPALDRTVAGQGIDYQVLVVEQAPGGLFNRAKLINAGADLARGQADYFCIQDVDTLPEVAEYGCPSQPLRMVKRLSRTFRPVDTYTGCYFSGAISITAEQFIAANGFDNGYWGSGSQDEDFFYRCLLQGLVPHEDTEGVFAELDNPVAEASYRSRRIRRRNKRRLVWSCYRETIGRSGMSDLRYRLLAERTEGPVRRVTVSL